MTKITFYKKNDLIIGFEVTGHTGKDEYGKDLLCCQISTIAQMAVMSLDEVEKVKNFHQISDGYLKITVSEKVAQEEKVQFMFKSCFLAFQSIINEEKKYAKMEVKNV